MRDADRRIRRTRRALTAALIELASHRPYESITIQDITDQADVGYATFFRHYGSKDDLMLDIFQNIASDLETLAGRHSTTFFEQEGRLIFAHVQANESLYRCVLDSLVFQRKFKALFVEHTRQHITRHMSNIPAPAVPLEIAVNHMATAFISLIEWWLAHEKQPPVDQMAQIYDRLIIQATMFALLGGDTAARHDEAHGTEPS